MDRKPPPRAERRRLTHVDRTGRPRMVDVSAKPATARRAVAEAFVACSRRRSASIIDGARPKGDVLTVAELAGVMGGKRTAELIPLCHPIAADRPARRDHARPRRGWAADPGEAATVGPTGVEMEALTAASVAALTVYDMVKGVERGVEIRSVRLVAKTGGKSGEWRRPADEPAPADRRPLEAATWRPDRRPDPRTEEAVRG